MCWTKRRVFRSSSREPGAGAGTAFSACSLTLSGSHWLRRCCVILPWALIFADFHTAHETMATQVVPQKRPAESTNLSPARAAARRADPNHRRSGKRTPPMANHTKSVTGIPIRVKMKARVAGMLPTATRPAPGKRRPSAPARAAGDFRFWKHQRPKT